MELFLPKLNFHFDGFFTTVGCGGTGGTGGGAEVA
jgi:hypothetical protein